jgi:IS1 family transposase
LPREKGKADVNTLSPAKKEAILTALLEGNSIRSTERMTGVHRDTIMRLVVSAGQKCEAILGETLRNIPAHYIQCDELWGYVQKKERNTRIEDPEEVGDQWVYVGMDAETKLIISYRVSKRSPVNTHWFVKDLYSRIIGRPQVTTDGYGPYIRAIEDHFGSDVDYAQLMKIYRYAKPGSEGYLPSRFVEAVSKPISGKPDEQHVSTSYVERQNLTMRMQIRRLTRLTNAFSKKLTNLKAAIALHFAYYNFCRVHSSLRVTPAMAAGITQTVWSLADLLSRATPAQVAA